MLIAQVTDIHLGFDPGNPDELNRTRLDRVLDALIAGPNRPDLLLLSGDLTDKGDVPSYVQLLEALARCDFPVWPCVGNHDDRANLAAHFPQAGVADGFVQYVVPLAGRRIVVIDTLEPGRHGGAFCARRAAWLAATLDADRTTPTLIVMHHPPVEVGIDWMNTHPEEPWVARFAAAIAGRNNVAGIVCGHIHRTIVAPWRGTTIAVCSSSAPQLALDLRPMDPDAPDDRAMVIADAPGYALHRWGDEGIVTHFATADAAPTLAKFDARMQGLVRMTMGERPA